MDPIQRNRPFCDEYGPQAATRGFNSPFTIFVIRRRLCQHDSTNAINFCQGSKQIGMIFQLQRKRVLKKPKVANSDVGLSSILSKKRTEIEEKRVGIWKNGATSRRFFSKEIRRNASVGSSNEVLILVHYSARLA